MRSESPAALQRQVGSVLVIKFRYLGDMVLLSPVIRNLRIAFPAAHLAVLADQPYTEALRHIPDLDEAIRLAPREGQYYTERSKAHRASINQLSAKMQYWIKANRADV